MKIGMVLGIDDVSIQSNFAILVSLFVSALDLRGWKFRYSH